MPAQGGGMEIIMAKDNEKKQGFFAAFGQSAVKWFKGIKAEVKKIIWPTPEKIGKDTLIVIVSVLVIGAFLSLVNWILMTGIDKIITR